MARNEIQPHVWEYDLWEPSAMNLESLLEASIAKEKARRASEAIAAQPVPISKEQKVQNNCTPSSIETVAQSTHAQLIGGCGIAAIDGYLAMRDYAASKGIDLVEPASQRDRPARFDLNPGDPYSKDG